MIELLSPAGSYEAFTAAIGAGADAVYVGGNRYGARAYANNFSEEELLRAIDYAHLYDKKLYLTVNTLCKDAELCELFDFLNPLYRAGLDGVIVQDLGVISYIRRAFPLLPVHASTQMTLTGALGAKYLKSLGATRIVTSRELSLTEIRAIKDSIDIEIESFVHGAMCYCYSGQCLFSGILGGRSGNRGRCAQPCRLPYDVYENGKQLNPEKEQYLLSMRDMCTLELIPQMIEAGVESFKIEGRMKKPSYTAGVTAIYRKYFDRYQKYGKDGFQINPADREKLMTLYSRSGSKTGYYEQRNGRDMITLNKPGYESQTDEQNFAVLSQIPVIGEFSCAVGKTMELTVRCANHEICVEGSVAESSEKHPATAETVEKQLNKTGDTVFRFQKLSSQIKGECFLPVKLLNELRREALEQLKEQILKTYRRTDGIHDVTCSLETAAEATPDTMFTAVVPSFQVLKSLLSMDKIRVFYLESNVLFEKKQDWEECEKIIKELQSNGKKIMLALPYLFRQKDVETFTALQQTMDLRIFDGYLIRNYEELQWVKEQSFSGETAADFNLYSFNQSALAQLKQDGIHRDTIPLELNSKEMEQRGIHESELFGYGYLPMMISAQCLGKTMNRCTGVMHTVTLKDRYQTEFPVQCQCAFCYNVILNSVPLSLHNEWKLIRRMKPKYVRLHFTIETPEQAVKVAEFYTSMTETSDKTQLPFTEFTKGHFKRGVE